MLGLSGRSLVQGKQQVYGRSQNSKSCRKPWRAPSKDGRPRRQRVRDVYVLRAKHGERPDPAEDEEGLLPEEDWTVPGGYQDSLSKNTQLGRAVDDACKELSALGKLEQDSLVKANDLLKQLGYKGDITAPQIPPKVNPEDRG